MTSRSSIKYISSLLDNPATIAEGDYKSVSLFRQSFPYFVPVRYVEALEKHRTQPFTKEMLTSVRPYLGDWMLFCDFVQVPAATVAAEAVKPTNGNGNGSANGAAKTQPFQPPVSTPASQPEVVVDAAVEDVVKEKEVAEPATPVAAEPIAAPQAEALPQPEAIAPAAIEEETPVTPEPEASSEPAEEPAAQPAIAETVATPAAATIPVPEVVAAEPVKEEAPVPPPAPPVPTPEKIKETVKEAVKEAKTATEPTQPKELVREPVVNKNRGEIPTLGDEPANGELVMPLYTEDYFRQQGLKISPDLPEDAEMEDLKIPHNEDEAKGLMVMMSFSEWLSHFKLTSQKAKEETEDQKALKTMWQKEKMAAAIEEENEEIPENVFELAVTSITKEDGLASESLADIYIKQKKYDKAIEMYRKLSLRNPQKNAYFARKIEEVLKEKLS